MGAHPESLPWTGNEEADRFLAESGLALLIGMLLDQQFPMERAFYGPYLLQERLGEPLDCTVIAETDPDHLAVIFRGPPAIHRYPGSMAKRTQEVCGVLLGEVRRRGGAALGDRRERGRALQEAA